MIWRCDLLPQYEAYRGPIDAAISRVLHSGRYVLAREVEAFESEFAAYMGGGHCVGVASGTDGLVLGLQAVGVSEGDEVVTTPYTAIPTVSAIIAAGAKPVFVDIDPKTYLLDIEQVPGAVTEQTRAVVPVHLFGNVVDVKRLRDLLPTDLPILEDACQAHGSTFENNKAGSLGTASAFSFYPTKNLGGYGDGGCVFTRDADVADRIRLLRMYGMTDRDHIVTDGVNSRLDEMQAAVLRAKLPHLDAMNSRRRELAGLYAEALKDTALTFQQEAPSAFSNVHVLAARCAEGRDDLIQGLAARDIQVDVFYRTPLHLQPPLGRFGFLAGDFPAAEALCKQAIALPMYPELPADALDSILQALDDLL